LLEAWHQLQLPTAAQAVVVAVSGGADSTALLLGIDELVTNGKLHILPIVAHLDHGLRKGSRKDSQWVSRLSKQLGYSVTAGRKDLKDSKGKRDPNLEQAARKARYDFLRKTATTAGAKFILTAHTLDDQAETVLMRLLRGSAAEGLSGTSSVRSVATNSDIQLARPLLSWARRADTEDYCRRRKVEFRHDEMNDDESFSRVRVRKQLLPLMESFNNRIVETLSRTATLLSEDATALSDQAKTLLESASDSHYKNETKSPTLNVDPLLQAPAAVRRRALREWILRARGDLRRLEMVHLVAVERLLSGERGGRVAELPDGIRVTRRRGKLELSNKKG
jgi:tRNA(Ile)-lysidine synthase